MDICNDYALAKFLNIFNSVLEIIQIIGPIIALASLTYLFIKLMSNPEDKNKKKDY